MPNFFTRQTNNTLQPKNINSTLKQHISQTPLTDILKQHANDQYLVIAYLHNEIRLGRYQQGTLTFADNRNLDENHLIELRAFNNTQEIYIRKINNKYLVRNITDGTGEPIETVDTTSNIFGKRVPDTNTPQGYTRLKEDGRKITITIPTTQQADNYALTTRSYITYDSDTGQAGFAYYRYVNITADRGEA